jgi:molybdopterin synthase catalytic subunit/molybdopterin converting factor small subunit
VRISVRLFAILRERAGRGALELDLPEGATVADAIERLREEPGLDEPLERIHVAAAVNREYASPADPLAAGDELALVPPVSGGGDAGLHVEVHEGALSLERIAARVARPRAGAVVSFQGVTRDVDRLDYEAYREMAEERIAAILRDCIREHGLEAAAAEHRVGSVPLGEASVVVAVSAAHRDAAFAGAREAIDRIKAEAPIWKREVEGSERRWVEGSPAPQGTLRRDVRT